jgi:hypothetical protein
VLSDPRSYAYWVIGSIEIRDADPEWPQAGSRFHHTVGLGPLRVKDHTVVEEVRPARYLQLQTKTRPLGNARVGLQLDDTGEGTRVTMTEDPADTPTALVFMPLTHVLMRGRNARSLERLAELAEGRRPMPGEEPDAPSRTPSGNGAVVNPEVRARRESGIARLPAIARGAVAGTVGAVVMSISTNAEMRLRGRAPSYGPAEAVAGIFGMEAGSERTKKLLGTAGHAATSISFGAVRGLLEMAGLGQRAAGAALFGVAMAPELVVVPALGATKPPWKWSAADGAISVLHHGVFTVATNTAYGLLGKRTA